MIKPLIYPNPSQRIWLTNRKNLNKLLISDARRHLMRTSLSHYRPSTNLGFSLIELIVACTITATIIGLSLPNFSNLIEHHKLDAAVMRAQTSLSLARAGAISHGRTVMVCELASKAPLSCTKSHKRNEDWQLGWLVFVDKDGNNQLSEKDIILQQFDATKTTPLIFNQNGRLRFFANGSSRSAGFYLCSRNSTDLRHLKILYTGRTRLVRNEDQAKLAMCKSKLEKT